MKRILGFSRTLQVVVWSIVLAVCFGSAPPLALAIGPTGTIVGTVTDQSGAAVPGATVSAINQGTAETRTVQADGVGNFAFPLLPVGNYTIKVGKAGFEAYQQKNIVLQVDQSVTANVALQLGAVTQTVTVTETAAGVNLVDVAVSHVVDQERIVDLPLNGRDTLQLEYVMPGVNYDNDNVAHAQGQHEGVVVNGNRPGSVYFLLDGVDMTDSYLSIAPVIPAPDALQEFDIQTSDFNAQYGRSSGGIVNAATKAGTNAWHGDLFEFLRNTSLNANNFFANEAGLATVPFKLNQFGGTIGGPIQKNKTFIFGYFQQTYQRKDEANSIGTTLTAAEQPNVNTTGVADFSALCASTPANCPRDPRTGAAFPGDIIPGNRIDPTAAKMAAALLPPPNTSSGGYTFAAPVAWNNDDINESQFVVRVDRTINQANSLFVRMFFNNDHGTGIGGNIPATSYDKDFRNDDPAITWTHTFSPTLLNSATIGFNRIGHFRGPTKSLSWGTFGGPPTASTLTLPEDFYTGITGSIGDANGAFRQNRQTWQASDGLSWVKGKHTVAFGGDYRKEGVNRWENYFTDPYYDFNGVFSGNALSDVLLGLPDYFTQDSPVYSELRHTAIDFYATDSFKVRSNLTLDAGLRWEPYFPPVDNLNDQICLDQTFTKRSQFYPSAPPGILFPGPTLGQASEGTGDPGCPRGLVPKRWANLAPRVGFNWDPFKTGKMSIRAAYGMFFDQTRLIGYNRFSTSQPFAYVSTIYDPGSSSNNYAPSLAGLNTFTNSKTVYPFPFVTPRTPAERAAYSPYFAGNWPTSALEDADNPNWNVGRAEEWNFTVQREFGTNYTVSASYVANRGYGLWISRESNPGIPDPFPTNWQTVCGTGSSTTSTNPDCPQNQGATLPTRRRLNAIQCGTGAPGVTGPCYGPFELEDNAAWSSYNALQITINRKFTHGLEFLGSYVYGKYLDIESYGAEGGLGPRDPNNIALSYGPSDNDVRSKFVVSYIWQVPHMKRFTGASSFALNGWSFQGVTTIQSGSPFTVSTPYDSGLTSIGSDTADLLGGQSPTIAHPSTGAAVHEWFNTSAFTDAAWGTYGNSARNMLYGPGIVDFDFAVFKDFPLSERWGKVEFRNENFNLFNHSNFYNPDSTVGDVTFGQILSARDPRFIQFALKWIF
jgi:hypothetical protein